MNKCLGCAYYFDDKIGNKCSLIESCFNNNKYKSKYDTRDNSISLDHYESGKCDSERFKKITNEMLELYKIKNKNYGNSFSEQFSEYGLTSVCIRLDDKIRRLKSLNKQLLDSSNGITQVDNQGESIKDTLIDLGVYSILALMELEKGDK